MKNYRFCYILIGIIILIGGITYFPGVGIGAEQRINPVIIITDVSGSMQDETCYSDNKEHSEDKINKIRVLKTLLLSIVREMNGRPCETGIYLMRYLSGDPAVYVPFVEIGTYENKEITDKINDEFETDYPVFSRRTPIAYTLRQLDQNELEAKQGSITILLISDGNETFYNIDDEWDRKEPEADDEIMGPLTEIRRLKKKYKDNLNLFTLYIENKCDKNKDENKAGEPHGKYLMDKKTAEKTGENDKHETGEYLLAEMAAYGSGKSYYGNAMINNEVLVKELAVLLCPEKEVVKQIAENLIPPPAPVLQTQPIVKAGPKDSDKDGVYDDADDCPGTPRGAKVNEKGCWILKGVNFDTAKWNIKPEYYPILNQVAEVLNQNPEIRVEVQGHTDNRGTAAFNKKLSENRAASVVAYLIKKGIDSERLSSSGYGYTRPVFPNNTPENRAANRRVELKPMP